jgi:hypothetical protein
MNVFNHVFNHVVIQKEFIIVILNEKIVSKHVRSLFISSFFQCLFDRLTHMK